MISINLYGLVNNDKLSLIEKRIKIVVKGHANFNNFGNDIVCAAVSTLVQTGIYSIQKLTEYKQKVIKEKNLLSVEINLTDSKNEQKLLIILETIIIGLEEIYKKYPKNIKIEYF